MCLPGKPRCASLGRWAFGESRAPGHCAQRVSSPSPQSCLRLRRPPQPEKGPNRRGPSQGCAYLPSPARKLPGGTLPLQPRSVAGCSLLRMASCFLQSCWVTSGVRGVPIHPPPRQVYPPPPLANLGADAGQVLSRQKAKLPLRRQAGNKQMRVTRAWSVHSGRGSGVHRLPF